jgi:hypothetical protein
MHPFGVILVPPEVSQGFDYNSEVKETKLERWQKGPERNGKKI